MIPERPSFLFYFPSVGIHTFTYIITKQLALTLVALAFSC
jgi:hypothetical protein